MPYGLQGKRPLITLASASSIPLDDKNSGKTISVNTARITAPTKDKKQLVHDSINSQLQGLGLGDGG